MAGLTLDESACVGICFEGFFYGLYSAIFAVYLHCRASNKGNILFYSLCALIVISTVMFAMDIAAYILGTDIQWYSFYVTSSIITGCCDFIAQSILIYRCWVVWNRNIRVVIIPSILAVTFFALWVPGSVLCILPVSEWVHTTNLTSFIISLAVNALVTGLIVFKITKVYWEALGPASVGNTLRAPGGSRFRPIIFIFIESGMALLCMQLAQIVLYIVPTNAAMIVRQLIGYIGRMLLGITPTIIQVRVSMGLSFHDHDSMVEATSSLRFASNQTTETSIMGQESRDEDIVLWQANKDINIVKT